MSEFRRIVAWKKTWMGNKGEPPTGAQDFVISNLKQDESPIASVSMRYGRLWCGMTLKDIERLIKKDYGLYEVLLADRKRKVYFDIDKSESTLEEIKTVILEHFPNAKMQISGRTGVEGLSVHIVLSNYYANNLQEMQPLKRFALCYAKMGFDRLVYTTNRNMKMINQSKQQKGKEIQEIQGYIEGSESLTKHLIMHDFDDDERHISTLDFKLLQELTVQAVGEKKGDKFDPTTLPDLKLEVPKDFDLKFAMPLEKLNMIPVDSLNGKARWTVMTWCKQVGITFEQFWNWNKRKSDTLQRFRQYEKAWNGTYHVTGDCVDLILQWLYPRINEPISTRILRRQFNVHEGAEVNSITETYLSAKHFDLTKKINIATGQMGRNKTGAVIEALKTLPEDARILWVAPRITLAQNTKQRLSKEGLEFVNYKDFTPAEKQKGCLDEHDKVICSVQSLKFVSKPFQVIVFDEIETILDTFSGNCNTHQKLQSNWETLRILCSSANTIIAMDAFTTRKTTNFLTGVTQCDMPYIIHSPPNNEFRKLIEFPSFESWLNNIMVDIEAGKKPYIFVPNKTSKHGVAAVGKALADKYGWTEGKEYLTYYAEQDANKQQLADVNRRWSDPELRCVITNGTISVGVNYDVEHGFDAVHAAYSPFMPPRDYFQSITRPRNPKDKNVYIVRTHKQVWGNYENVTLNCPIFKKLRDDLDVERRANHNTKGWETFNLFAEKSNFRVYPTESEMITKETSKLIDKMLDESNVIFSYDNIPTLEELIQEEGSLINIDELDSKISSGLASLRERLVQQKYYWNRMFRDDADLRNLAFIWDENPNFAFKVNAIAQIEKKETTSPNKKHLITKLLQENQTTIQEVADKGFPDNMETTLPLNVIQHHFKFHNAPSNLRTQLVAHMLNTYFQLPVYTPAKLEKKDKKKQIGEGEYRGRRPYVTDDDFKVLLESVLEELRCNAPVIDILVDYFE